MSMGSSGASAKGRYARNVIRAIFGAFGPAMSRLR
jgi:hypothetical protein